MSQENPQQPVRPDWVPQYTEPVKIIEMMRASAPPEATKEATRQAEAYESSVLTLMDRTQNNSVLVETLGGFVNALEGRSWFGNLDEPLSQSQQQDLIDFFSQATDRLNGTDANGQHTGWSIIKD